MTSIAASPRAPTKKAIVNNGLAQAAPLRFWLIGLGLVVYVGLCTGFRDNVWGADAWEHDRAILALTQQLWHAGNPTFATPEPSVRYSPYTIALALLCRATGMSVYSALSAAAVINTALFIVAFYALLRTFNMAAISAYALIIAVGLYGSIPGFANSLALADLPVQQVNPSAFSLPLALFTWALFQAGSRKERDWSGSIWAVVLSTIAMLSHGFTGVFEFVVLLAMVLAAPRELQTRMAKRFAGVAVATFVLCALWPWYSFIEAITTRRDLLYWFSPTFVKFAIMRWAAPALLLLLPALALRHNALVRTCLAGAGLSLGLAILALTIKSPVLERLPLTAILLLQLPVAAFMYERHVLRPGTWGRRLRELVSLDTAQASRAAVETMCAAVLVYCLLPQCSSVTKEPSLARPYLAHLLGKADKREHVRERFEQLLQPVGPRDVVLSDEVTSWPIPSFRGRVVTGLHYELFTPDQPQRERDVAAFFAAKSDHERFLILGKYNVRWIVLNRAKIPPAIFDALFEPAAVSSQADGLILMNANRWRTQREQQAH